MKYVKPDLDIIKFDAYIRTVDVGSSNPNATEDNVPNINVGDDTLWN